MDMAAGVVISRELTPFIGLLESWLSLMVMRN